MKKDVKRIPTPGSISTIAAARTRRLTGKLRIRLASTSRCSSQRLNPPLKIGASMLRNRFPLCIQHYRIKVWTYGFFGFYVDICKAELKQNM